MTGEIKSHVAAVGDGQRAGDGGERTEAGAKGLRSGEPGADDAPFSEGNVGAQRGGQSAGGEQMAGSAAPGVGAGQGAVVRSGSNRSESGMVGAHV